MDWVTMLDVWTTRTFVGEDHDNPRTFYNISWLDAKGETNHFYTQNFYEFIYHYRALLSVCEHSFDPRDNEFMIEHYSNEPQDVVV